MTEWKLIALAALAVFLIEMRRVRYLRARWSELEAELAKLQGRGPRDIESLKFDAKHTNPFLRPSRWVWPFQQQWMSICSRHREPKASCDMCCKGCWASTVAMSCSRTFYRLAPVLWRKWANRKTSPMRERLEAIFPNLKS